MLAGCPLTLTQSIFTIHIIYLVENYGNKDVHIVVPFAYLSSSYSKFEWAENAAVQAHTKKGEQ